MGIRDKRTRDLDERVVDYMLPYPLLCNELIAAVTRDQLL
jgi:hypothetical protein